MLLFVHACTLKPTECQTKVKTPFSRISDLGYLLVHNTRILIRSSTLLESSF